MLRIHLVPRGELHGLIEQGERVLIAPGVIASPCQILQRRRSLLIPLAKDFLKIFEPTLHQALGFVVILIAVVGHSQYFYGFHSLLVAVPQRGALSQVYFVEACESPLVIALL